MGDLKLVPNEAYTQCGIMKTYDRDITQNPCYVSFFTNQ
jgi:hypothetical protein